MERALQKQPPIKKLKNRFFFLIFSKSSKNLILKYIFRIESWIRVSAFYFNSSKNIFTRMA